MSFATFILRPTPIQRLIFFALATTIINYNDSQRRIKFWLANMVTKNTLRYQVNMFSQCIPNFEQNTTFAGQPQLYNGCFDQSRLAQSYPLAAALPHQKYLSGWVLLKPSPQKYCAVHCPIRQLLCKKLRYTSLAGHVVEKCHANQASPYESFCAAASPPKSSSSVQMSNSPFLACHRFFKWTSTPVHACRKDRCTRCAVGAAEPKRCCLKTPN
jgi:hypothetical protein